MRTVIVLVLAIVASVSCSGSRNHESRRTDLVTIVVTDGDGGYLLQGSKVDERTMVSCFHHLVTAGFTGAVRIRLPEGAPVSSAYSLCGMLESNGVTNIEINVSNRIRE